MNKSLYWLIGLAVIFIALIIFYFSASGPDETDSLETTNNTTSTQTAESSKESGETTQSDLDFMEDFNLTNLAGEKVAYADLEGTTTFIRFSSTTCTICKSENHDLAAVLADPPENTRFVEINIAESEDTVRQYLADQGLEIEALLDSNGAATINNRVLGTPTHFVLRPDTSICDRNSTRLSEDAIRSQLAACS